MQTATYPHARAHRYAYPTHVSTARNKRKAFPHIYDARALRQLFCAHMAHSTTRNLNNKWIRRPGILFSPKVVRFARQCWWKCRISFTSWTWECSPSPLLRPTCLFPRISVETSKLCWAGVFHLLAVQHFLLLVAASRAWQFVELLYFEGLS